MNPLLIAKLAAQAGKLGISAAKGIAGASQKQKAKKLMKQYKRPVRKTPSSVTAATNVARMTAGSPLLPGQSNIEKNFRGATSDIAHYQKEMGNRDVSSMYGNFNKNMQNLQTQQLAGFTDRQADYTSQLNKEGVYQEKNATYNQENKYSEAMASAKALNEAGNQNIMNGAKGIVKNAPDIISTIGAANADKKLGKTDSNTGETVSAGIPEPGQQNKTNDLLLSPNAPGKPTILGAPVGVNKSIGNANPVLSQPPNPVTVTPSENFQRTNLGSRADGTPKGKGYFGILKRPDGSVSSEISVGVGFDGKETEIPLLVPGLTDTQIAALLSVPTDKVFSLPEYDNILKIAIEHAKKRMSQGLSPFKD